MFHEMRYLYEVYRERSFSKAAQKLYISQPSLSAMVRKAEQRIGGPIFDRSTLPIGVTPIGMEYIGAAEQMMEIEDGFRQYLSDVTHCLTGSLSVGGTTLFTSYILPPLISAFSGRYPAVAMRMHEAHTGILERMLSDGTLDLIADNYSFDPLVYGREPFLTERLLLAVPVRAAVNEAAAEYRLTAGDVIRGRHMRGGAPAVPLALFCEEPFLLLREGNDTRIRADKLCARARFAPEIRLLLDQQITAYNLTLSGMGASFISDTLIRHVPSATDVWFYALDEDLAQRDVCFYYKKSRHPTSIMREFMKTVREITAAE